MTKINKIIIKEIGIFTVFVALSGFFLFKLLQPSDKFDTVLNTALLAYFAYNAFDSAMMIYHFFSIKTEAEKIEKKVMNERNF